MNPRHAKLDRLLAVGKRLPVTAPIEELIALLRREGASKIDTILVLKHVRGTQIYEAKNLVDSSPTWADVRERDAAFHEDLFRAAEDLEREQREKK